MSSTNTYTEQKYCVYITHYSGNALSTKTESTISPSNYIGSTSVDKINNGYKGSVSSKKYKTIWESELKNNPHLFSVEIISYHDTRPEATYKELQLQRIFNVLTNPLFVNMSYAQPKGYLGMSDSDLASRNQLKLVEENKHIFQGKFNNKRLLSLGIHSTQDPDFIARQSKRNNDLVAQGKHYFQSEESIENNRKMQNELVANGTHWLLSGDIQRETARRNLKNNEHIMQLMCSCIYCKSESSYPVFVKIHGDKCKLSPNYDPIIYDCLYCNKTSISKANMNRYHNDNCKHKP
jgi:hypothetical protein